jgi:hypothetical protein
MAFFGSFTPYVAAAEPPKTTMPPGDIAGTGEGGSYRQTARAADIASCDEAVIFQMTSFATFEVA